LYGWKRDGFIFLSTRLNMSRKRNITTLFLLQFPETRANPFILFKERHSSLLLQKQNPRRRPATVFSPVQSKRFTLKSEQFKCESTRWTLQSGRFKFKSGQFKLQSRRFKCKSGRFTLQSRQFKFKSDQFTLQSGQFKCKSDQFKLQSRQFKFKSGWFKRVAL
jgi:hypothetical protein